MSNRTKLAACFSTLAATIALASGEAHATTFSGDGWLQLYRSSNASTSTSIEGEDFGVGYWASTVIEGYNWDVAGDTISFDCVTYEIETNGFFVPKTTKVMYAEPCPVLPSSQVSRTVLSKTHSMVGFQLGWKVTTRITYDVPDSGVRTQASTSFRVPVTLFDEDFEVLWLTGDALGTADGLGTSKVKASVHVLGAKVKSGSTPLPASTTLAQHCATLAEAEAGYALAGAPITVSADVVGCLYLDASASFDDATLTGTLRPGANVDVTLKVGVGADAEIVSAEAGVYGTITVVDVSVPLSLSSAVTPTGVTVTQNAKLTMTGLDGEAGLYAEACFLFACHEETLKIFDWTGMTYANKTLWSASESISW